MPVRIRLARFGHVHRPFYRVRVCDGRSPRDGKFIEVSSSSQAAGAVLLQVHGYYGSEDAH